MPCRERASVILAFIAVSISSFLSGPDASDVGNLAEEETSVKSFLIIWQ